MKGSAAVSALPAPPVQLVAPPAPEGVPDLITAKELAVLLKCSVRRVYDMTKAGEIPFYPVRGRKKYCADEVFAALYRPVRLRATILALGAQPKSEQKHVKVEAVAQ